MTDLRVLTLTDPISLSRYRMPLLGGAPGPLPASEWVASARVGWSWFVWCWLYNHARPVHDWRWRRLLGR